MLRLGSTFEHVSSSVKSRRLVPCMWTSETRLHKGLQSRRRRHYLSTAPCFHQQSEAARACMTSVGMRGKKCALLIGSNGRRGRSRGGFASWNRTMRGEMRVTLVTIFVNAFTVGSVKQGKPGLNAYLTRISKT